jgi:CheY-like chemotaxis protein
MKPLRILVVDDESMIRDVIKDILIMEGHDVVEANDGPEGLKQIVTGRFHLIITDKAMPKMSGECFAVEAKRLDDQCRIILLTGYSDLSKEDESTKKEIDLVLSKPVSMMGLIGSVESLFAD